MHVWDNIYLWRYESRVLTIQKGRINIEVNENKWSYCLEISQQKNHMKLSQNECCQPSVYAGITHIFSDCPRSHTNTEQKAVFDDCLLTEGPDDVLSYVFNKLIRANSHYSLITINLY